MRNPWYIYANLVFMSLLLAIYVGTYVSAFAAAIWGINGLLWVSAWINDYVNSPRR